jgi:hypothetical protein
MSFWENVIVLWMCGSFLLHGPSITLLRQPVELHIPLFGGLMLYNVKSSAISLQPTFPHKQLKLFSLKTGQADTLIWIDIYNA